MDNKTRMKCATINLLPGFMVLTDIFKLFTIFTFIQMLRNSKSIVLIQS